MFATAQSRNDQTTSFTAGQLSKKEIGLIEARTMLVELYGDPEIDDNVKMVINKFWRFNKDIHFANMENTVGLLKGNESKFFVLSVNKVEATEITKYGVYTNYFIRFSIKLGEKHNKTRPAFFQDVLLHEENGKTTVDKRDIIFAVNYIQNHFEARKAGKSRFGLFMLEVKENSGKLENKTLLIDEKQMDKKMDVSKIAQDYVFPYKISNLTEIENAQLSQDKRYAYVEIIPIGGSRVNNFHLVVDCETGLVISYGDLNNGAFDFTFSNLINNKHLKSYYNNSGAKK